MQGNFKGRVSLQKYNLDFAFDYSPALNAKFQDIDINKELKRICFELEMDSNANQKIRLVIMSRGRL